MQAAIPLIFNTLTLISILLIVSLGLAIIFGLMNVINLAHGEFITIGAFTLVAVQALGGSFWLALLVAPAVGYCIGLLLERILIARVYKNPLHAILVTWGLSLIIQQVLVLTFGPSPQRATGPFEGAISIAGANYPGYRLFLIAFALATFATIVVLFKRTRFGLDLRASIQSTEMAAVMGVDADKINARAFAIGAALAALAGVLLAPLTAVTAFMGVNYLARSFFVVLVGGAGSVAGVAAGSGIIGGLETMLSYQIPATVAQALVLVRRSSYSAFVRPGSCQHERARTQHPARPCETPCRATLDGYRDPDALGAGGRSACRRRLHALDLSRHHVARALRAQPRPLLGAHRDIELRPRDVLWSWSLWHGHRDDAVRGRSAMGKPCRVVGRHRSCKPRRPHRRLFHSLRRGAGRLFHHCHPGPDHHRAPNGDRLVERYGGTPA